MAKNYKNKPYMHLSGFLLGNKGINKFLLLTKVVKEIYRKNKDKTGLTIVYLFTNKNMRRIYYVKITIDC
jgi:hypothetical protein